MAKVKKGNKGAPSGLIISLLFHAAAFFVAGLFVVFTVVNKKEPEFTPPPPVERPKMNLKKPKVKVQKNSNPKPSSRIVAKVKTKEMPEIQLPDLMGSGTGMMGGSGIGGEFLDLPEIQDLNLFGQEESTGNDLAGKFYDFKRRSDGAKKPIGKEDVDGIIHKFMKQGWRESLLSQYYRSSKTLYSPCVCIGTVQSTLAPEAFGEDTEGWGWAVLYRGKLVYPEDIKFRFRGVGDKFMGVRVDGKVVLLCQYRQEVRQEFADIWWSSASDARVYPMGESKQQVGDWIELKAGVPVDIEIILGDREGGLVYHQLVVEVDGVDYPKSSYGGGPVCPVFKTDNLTHTMIDALLQDVYPVDVNFTNGPVFCDYMVEPVDYTPEMVTNIPPVFVKDDVSGSRTWTGPDGQSMDGRFLLQAEDYVLVDVDGKQRKLPLDMLSDADRLFVELAKPPKFKMDFFRDSEHVDMSHLVGPYVDIRGHSITDCTLGAKIRQTSSGNYGQELKLEIFAIGQQVNDNDKFILFDRKSETFVPNELGRKEFRLETRKVRLRNYQNRCTSKQSTPFRGQEYKGYLMVLTDSLGRVVQYDASSKFLFENLTRLQKLPVGSYFDKHCVRVFPTGPGEDDRADWVLMSGDGNN